MITLSRFYRCLSLPSEISGSCPSVCARACPFRCRCDVVICVARAWRAYTIFIMHAALSLLLHFGRSTPAIRLGLGLSQEYKLIKPREMLPCQMNSLIRGIYCILFWEVPTMNSSTHIPLFKRSIRPIESCQRLEMYHASSI